MNTNVKFSVYFLLLFLSSLLNADSYASFDKFQSQGILTSFWRGQPVTINSLDKMELGIVPGYLQKTSFPYKNSPNQGLLFADKLTVVRLLGGLNPKKLATDLQMAQSLDLAYRDKHGQIKYRWNLLEARLSPLIEAGYKDLTLVLDNTPWAFTSKPKIGHYGQTTPPDSIKEWEIFIEVLCTKLVDLYGFDMVNHWRFRLGTENQGLNRFNGTQKQYLQMYHSTVKAVKKVLPGAGIGPFNQAHGIENTKNNNVDYMAILSQSLSDTKVTKNAAAVPVSFVSISSYLVPNKKERSFVRQLEKKAQKQQMFFHKVESILPVSMDIPREVHEFGVIKTKEDVRISAPGLYGTLIRFFMMFDYYKDPVTQLYHWNVLDTLRRGPDGNHLLNGEGWLYSILEYAADGELYMAPDVYIDEKTVVKTFLVDVGDKVFIFLGALTDRNIEQNIGIIMSLSPSFSKVLNFKKVLEVSYNAESSVHNVIKNDLKRSGLLKPPLMNSKLTSNVGQMGGRNAVKNVISRWKKYEEVMIESLTLKKSSRLKFIGGENIQINIQAPELSVFVIEKNN